MLDDERQSEASGDHGESTDCDGTQLGTKSPGLNLFRGRTRGGMSTNST